MKEIDTQHVRPVGARYGSVVLVARREERLKEVATELAMQHGIETRVLAVDLAAEGAFQA